MSAFDKIIGYQAIKNDLMQIVDTLKNTEAYQRLGVKPPRGLLLYGEPGVGKTLMADAVIAESGRQAFLCRKDSPNGDFVKKLKKTFTDAKAAAPSIVLLDDMDKFTNGDERHRDAEEYVTVQACIDGIKKKDVFVIATANNLHCLPDSLLREGRFDRRVKVGNPQGADAEAIVAYYLGQKKHLDNLDPREIARMMNGRSCAALETLINEAGILAGSERAEAISMDHFMKAGLHIFYHAPTDALRELEQPTDLRDKTDPRVQIIYHEAGHAAVAEALAPGSVTMMLAYYGSQGSQGFVQTGREGRGTKLTGAREDEICVCLGSLAATEQKFGICDQGSERDLNHAFEMVTDMLTENCTSGFSLHGGQYGSQQTQYAVEQMAAAEMEHYYRRTKRILAENWDLLEGIAAALAGKNLLTAADIAAIRNGLAGAGEAA